MAPAVASASWTLRIGADEVMFWARPGGLPIDLANRSLERFARDVMPRLR